MIIEPIIEMALALRADMAVRLAATLGGTRPVSRRELGGNSSAQLLRPVEPA